MHGKGRSTQELTRLISSDATSSKLLRVGERQTVEGVARDAEAILLYQPADVSQQNMTGSNEDSVHRAILPVLQHPDTNQAPQVPRGHITSLWHVSTHCRITFGLLCSRMLS